MENLEKAGGRVYKRRSKSAMMGDSSTMPIGLAEKISQQASGIIQSPEHSDLLDIVDTLRASGVGH